MAVFRFGIFQQTVRLSGVVSTAEKVTVQADVRKKADASFELTRIEAEKLHADLGTVLGKGGH